MATIKSEVATGRRINGLEGLMDVDPPCHPEVRAAHSSQRRARQPADLFPPHCSPRQNPQEPSSPPVVSPCFRSAASPAHRSQSARLGSRRRSGSPARPRLGQPSPVVPPHSSEADSGSAQHHPPRLPLSYCSRDEQLPW